MARASIAAVLLALGCAAKPPPPTQAPASAPAIAEAKTDDPSPPPEAEPVAEPESAAPAEPDIHGYAPLSEAQRALLAGGPTDPPVEVRLGVTKGREGKQYLAGNEKTPQAFRPFVEGRGGGYLGVGSDQAYLMIGWMRPHIAWLTDYDPDVIAIHDVYRAFFAEAETPAALIELFSREAKDRGIAIIRAAYEGEHATRLVGLYANNRGWIHRRLVGLSRRLVRAKVSSYLDDQATYDFVREFVASGRAQPVLANLLADQGIAGISETARAIGVEIEIVYLSNAEEYWPHYPDNFRTNIAQLPVSDDALILRALLTWDINQDYRYNVQTVDNYRRWLAAPYIDNVYDVVHTGPPAVAGEITVFETDREPEDSPAARRAERAAAEADAGR